MRAVAVLLGGGTDHRRIADAGSGDKHPTPQQNCAIAAGGGVRETTLNCGYTAAEVERLIRRRRRRSEADTAQNEAILKLKGEIGLTEGAVRAVLSSLGRIRPRSRANVWQTRCSRDWANRRHAAGPDAAKQ